MRTRGTCIRAVLFLLLLLQGGASFFTATFHPHPPHHHRNGAAAPRPHHPHQQTRAASSLAASVVHDNNTPQSTTATSSFPDNNNMVQVRPWLTRWCLPFWLVVPRRDGTSWTRLRSTSTPRDHDEAMKPLVDLNLPAWASSDRAEKQRLATMKSLLQQDFAQLSNQTVTLMMVPESKQTSRHFSRKTHSKHNAVAVALNVVDAFPDVFGDLRLLRFLRKDAVPDPARAADRYRAFLQWRLAGQVDRWRAVLEQTAVCQPYESSSWPGTPAAVSVRERQFAEHMALQFPADFQRRRSTNDTTTTTVITTLQSSQSLPSLQSSSSEYDSFPIVLHVGDWKMRDLADDIAAGTVDLQDFLAYWTSQLEALHRDMYLASYQTRRVVYVDVICDLAHLSWQQVSSPVFLTRVLKPWIDMVQQNYPETTKRIVFLNPPPVLSMVWKVVAKFVSPRTLAKVKVTGFQGSCEDFVQQLYK